MMRGKVWWLIGCVLGKALGEGNRWYFYSRKIEGRVTDNGFWNPLGRDDPVLSTATSEVVGMKKYFLFHLQDADAGPLKTNWIMHEFRLADAAAASSSSSSRRRGRPKRVRHLISQLQTNFLINVF